MMDGINAMNAMALNAKNAMDRMPTEDALIERVARELLASGAGPFDAETLSWAVRRAAPADPLPFADKLIDAMLRVYDLEHGPRRGPMVSRVCYRSCSPDDPCSYDFGGGSVVRHAGRGWLVQLPDGSSREFGLGDRNAAERHARKGATMTALAAAFSAERRAEASAMATITGAVR